MTNPSLTEDDLELLLARLRRPAIAMLRTTEADDAGTPGCWFGGQPTLPADVDWPTYQVPGTDIVIPHHFLAQINLDYLPRVVGLPALPKTGTFFVFYEYLFAPYVASGSALQNGEGLRVIYVEHDVSSCPLQVSPAMPDISELPFDLQMEMAEENLIFRKSEYFQFVVFDSYPTTETARAMGHADIPNAYLAKQLYLEECISRDVNAIRYPGGEFPPGYPHGPKFDSIFGCFQSQAFPNKEYFEKQKRPCIAPVEQDHVLIFRFVDIGMQFPVCFWIREQDLIDKNFDNIFAWEEI